MAFTTRFLSSIHKIGKATWSALLNTDNPFLSFEFLAALEDNRCISSSNNRIAFQETGWQAHYLVIYKEETTPVAIAPVFKKLHSYGEYVFDWSWADAYQRHGLTYYPKLVWGIPFTPSTGPRFIALSDAINYKQATDAICQSLTHYCQQYSYSSWHCLFPQADVKEIAANSSLARTSCQFHWYNKVRNNAYDDEQNNTGNSTYNSFDHYLESFTSRKRKSVKKERRRLLESQFEFSRKSGDQICEQDIITFYQCYQSTYLKRGMKGYLNLEFFKQLKDTMAEQLVLVQARLDDDIIASALYFRDSQNLYGRYWGCLDEYDGLHFECCYYQGIEYCIEQGLLHFDPGTQGEHKISRGFEPTLCHSTHWIEHPQFCHAINNFLIEEQQDIQHYMAAAAKHLPFKSLDHQ